MLTGDGDAPGLNAAICGLGRRLWRAGHRLVGFPEGWRGLIEGEATELDPEQFHDLLTRGGSILGTGSASPYRESKRDVPRLLAVFRRLGLHVLVAIGGAGALHSFGRRAAIVAGAEGTRLFLGKRCISSLERDEFGHYLTGGVAEVVARHVQERLGWEARPMVLGHLQRCGKPIAFDRIFALRLGARAAGLVLAGRFGRMAALRNGELSDIPLEEAIAEPSTLSEHFLDRYENFFLPISHI